MDSPEMKQFPKELMTGLKSFVFNYIGDKILDAVTYALFYDGEESLSAPCEEAYLDSNDYFGELEVMRKVKTCNGIVYDVDMSLICYILKEWLESDEEKGVDMEGYDELIGNTPETERESEIKRFSELCIDTFKKQNRRKLEVALYSMARIPILLITGRNQQNKSISLYYHAFALRQWDIEAANKNYLVPNGIRVNKLEVCDILPERQGVRFIVHLTGV